jgi:predicted GNAT family acetyltransferase
MSDQPYPFSDLALARRLERAEAHANAKFVEARARIVPLSRAGWIEVAGAYALFDGITSPVTQTFGLGLFDAVTDADLERIERFFEERGAPVSHELSPLSGPELAALLAQRGYRPIEFSNVMIRPIQVGGQASVPDGRIVARPIRADEHELWVETAARGWRFGQASASGWTETPELAEFLRALGPVVTSREDSVSFLGLLDGEAVAAGALCLHDGVALLAGACTVLEARKQGAQRALLESRLRHAAEHGCDVAAMCVQPGSASQRNAERHAFRVAYTRTKWQLSRGS